MQPNAKIVVLGDLLYDCIACAERLPRAGESVIGYDIGFFPGGKGANQAVQAAKLGADVSLLGCVGNDERGHFLLSKLNEYGVNTDFIKIEPNVATGTCCIHVANDGTNALVIASMANEKYTPRDIEQVKVIIESADVFLTQCQLPAETVYRGLSIAKSAGITTIFDPAPPRDFDERMFSLADFFTPNETEAEFYSGISRDNMTLATWCSYVGDVLHKKGVKNLLLTLGSKGVYYSNGDVSFHIDSIPANAVDTTGAGDSFAAAFAVALLRNYTIKQAVYFANIVASITTTKKGGQPSMPKQDDVVQFIEEKHLAI